MSLIQPVVKYICNTELSTSPENAGYDLRSTADLVIPPGGRVIVPTGLKIEMPHHMYAQVFSRSGLASRGVDACGGVIDSGYRNDIGVILHNTNTTEFVVKVGDRVAQLVFLPIYHPQLVCVSGGLSDSERGERGFGSSGMQ
jgi:dUTP pyrophosphatase